MDVQKRQPRGAIWFRRIAITALLLSLLAAVGFSVSYLTNVEPTVRRETLVIDTVKYGTFLHEIRGVGQLVSKFNPRASAQTGGRVRQVFVLPGEQVDHDTILVELTNHQLQLDLTEAQSALDAARAKLKTERASLQNKQRELESAYVKLKSDYDQAAAEHEVSKSLAERSIEPPHKMRLKQIKADSLGKQLAVAKKSFDEFNLEEQLAVHEEEIKRASAKLDLVKSNVEALKVKANFKGLLVETPVEVGQQVAAGEVLATMVDPKSLKAELKISEVESRFIRLGQPARVDTHLGIVKGKVSRIDSAVEFGSITIDVAFDEALPEDARPNLSVNGMIEVGRIEEVLHVGRPVGVQPESDVELFLVDPSKRYAIRMNGKVGAASVNDVEICHGFTEGDSLILSNMDRYTGYDRVRLE